MTNYPCPACGATADLDAGCSGCGRPPDPAAAEVIRLDGVLAELAAAVQTARLAYDQSTKELAATRSRRNALAAEVRAWTGFQVTRTATPTVPPLAPPPAVATAPEASTRTVQNVLFTLGGLLLGTAAVVFTAVAWATYGVGGRAVILATVTGLALGAPLLALKRRLVATAETFAALGLLLVVLDGYAAWYVNLFGLAETVAPSTYAAGVGAVTAAVAAGYGSATRLTGPHIVALVVAQPVLPLAIVDLSPEPAGWAVVFAVVAAADLAVLRWLRGPWRVLVLVLSGSSLAIAGGYALWAELFAADPDDAARAGLAMLAVAATLLAGAAASADRTLREVAAGIAAVAVVVALGRYLAFVAPDHRLVLIAALIAAVALVARLAVPVGWRTGARVGAGVAVGVVGTVVVALALWAAGVTVWAAQPSWHADLARVSFLDWGLPAAVLLLAAGAVTALPRTAWPPVAAIAAGLAAVSLAPALDLPWWAPSTVDLLVAVPLAVGLRSASVREWVAVALAGHAVLVGLARPASTAWALWSIVAICILVLVVGHRRSVALAVAVVILPPAVQASVVVAGGTGSAALRWGLVAAALGVAVVAAVRRLAPDLRWAAVAGASAAVLYASSTAALGDGEPYGVHGAAGLLLLAAIAGLATPDPDRRVLWVPGAAAIGPAVPAVLGAVPGLAAVLILPYSWLGSIWSGPPERGPGLTPRGGWSVDNAAITLALLTVAAALAGTTVGRRGALAGALLVGPAALLVGPTAVEARWPTVPFLALVLGLACALGVTLFRLPAPAAVHAVALTGAGLAGLLPTRGTTLAGLGLVVVVTAAIAAAGRGAGVRVVGWLTSFSAGVLLAIAATRAADLPLRTAAFAVLAVAAVALAVARAAARATASRRPELVAVEVAAHAGAAVAAVLAGGSLGHTAAIFTLWGIALALCALGSGARQGYPAAAGGCELVAWWLLMSANEVAVLEAYTLPAAAVAALVGVLALRRRPELRSWAAYGPALAAAFLPSLASALVVDGEPVRRLVLGAGAVVVVVAGAVRRRQAPVAVGGVVLVVLALREMAVWWDLIPRWIPLAAAGFLLVGLAMTYERRRRDLARLRDGFRQLT